MTIHRRPWFRVFSSSCIIVEMRKAPHLMNALQENPSVCFHIKSLDEEWVMDLLIKSPKVSVGAAEG